MMTTKSTSTDDNCIVSNSKVAVMLMLMLMLTLMTLFVTDLLFVSDIYVPSTTTIRKKGLAARTCDEAYVI